MSNIIYFYYFGFSIEKSFINHPMHASQIVNGARVLSMLTRGERALCIFEFKLKINIMFRQTFSIGEEYWRKNR